MLRFLLLPVLTSAVFDPDFYNFLVNKYGVVVADDMNRADNNSYAYGGGASTSGKHPLIIGHGITGNAGEYDDIIAELKNAGWVDEDIFSTTFGTGIATASNFLSFTFKCEYVEKIRRLIESVSEYRNTTVNYIGYSFGAPLGRKAILGGNCTENKKNLGGPLTDKVNVYLSVGGSNWGSGQCFLPTPIPAVCNGLNGLFCSSTFIRNINAPDTRYEGTYSYSIFSTVDDIVMNGTICGKHPGIFKNTEMRWVRRKAEKAMEASLGWYAEDGQPLNVWLTHLAPTVTAPRGLLAHSPNFSYRSSPTEPSAYSASRLSNFQANSQFNKSLLNSLD